MSSEKNMPSHHIPSYPKIYNLGHAAIADIFSEDVIVEEKVDGSQFSFGRLDGELVCRSRGAIIQPEAPPKIFAGAVETAKRVFPNLHEGQFVRGEALQTPAHNALRYSRVPKGNLILFDVNTANEIYLHRTRKEEFAEANDLEVVPIVYRGMLNSAAEVLALLDRESILGGAKIEGLVVKNYSRFTIDGKAMMGKYVSEAFKETNDANWKVQNPSKADIIVQIIGGLKTEARWQKAVQHLREEGKILNEPKDIGLLIVELRKDIYEEEGEQIRNLLFKAFIEDINRGVFHGFPEWYKKTLLEKSFQTETAQ